MNQHSKNALEHRFRLLQHFIVPEPNHAKSTSRKILRSLEIVEQIIGMLTPVNFHDQPRPHADEIHDVVADGLLSPEAIRAEMTVAQVTPQATFGVGRVRA